MQMIFQDPISSLNPRRRVKRHRRRAPRLLEDASRATSATRIVHDLLNKVGIDPEVYGDRYARQFSGGQCQRISIARSLAMRPKLLICDEMVSALDVSVQAQILNLLEDLKAEYGLTLLFIAHDLAVVKNVSDRVAVMYLGKICEIGPADTLYESPAHPYTKFLLGAALEADPDAPMHGEVLDGRTAEPAGPAERLSLSHALPVRDREVRQRGAPAPGGRARTTTSRVTTPLTLLPRRSAGGARDYALTTSARRLD